MPLEAQTTCPMPTGGPKFRMPQTFGADLLESASSFSIIRHDHTARTIIMSASKGRPRKIHFLPSIWRVTVIVYAFFTVNIEALNKLDSTGPALISSVLTYERTIERFTTAASERAAGGGRRHSAIVERKLRYLVDEPAVILNYHNGALMNTGSEILVHLVWYGPFSNVQKSIICDFLRCFGTRKYRKPSVKSWWNVTQGYKDDKGSAVTSLLKLGTQIHDHSCSRGLSLTENDLQAIIWESFNSTEPKFQLPMVPTAIYLLLTAENVYVEDFCMNSCASHFATSPVDETMGVSLAFAWVGNSGRQCPGQCAWPFAQSEYGPSGQPLIAPNGDVGVDGMIINMAAMLAGSATNPFNTGFYQGDAMAPLEAATACAGIFGPGAYPGFPGELKLDSVSGASYNAHGWWNSSRKFLLPALWNPVTLICTPP